MKSILTVILLVTATWNLLAQEDSIRTFEVKISSDSILLGNYLEVRFTAHNLQGEFEPPRFTDFEIVGGPNQSTSMKMMNGKTRQTVSFSYFIKPKTTGVLHIEPAYFTNAGDQNYETPPLEVLCLPNPDGIVQESRIEEKNERLNFGGWPFFDDKPAQTRKKKLKVTKI